MSGLHSHWLSWLCILSATALFLSMGAGQALGDTDGTVLEETLITAETLEMVSEEEESRFLFIGNVRIDGTNLMVTCDRLTVISRRGGDPDATLGEIGSIRLIIAEGNVVIEQAGRRATAGKATILPGQGRVVLEDQPVIIDQQGRVEGWRMTLLRGENRAIVEGGPDGARPRVRLPSLPDLGARTTEEGPSEILSND